MSFDVCLKSFFSGRIAGIGLQSSKRNSRHTTTRKPEEALFVRVRSRDAGEVNGKHLSLASAFGDPADRPQLFSLDC
jgi:hypothetical protein